MAYEVTVPSFDDKSSPMDRLLFADNQNWIGHIATEITDMYWSLPREERMKVDPVVLEETWVVEAFVAAVIDAYTHGRADLQHGHTFFQNTDDKNWVIAFAHFIQDGVPYRFNVQYSLSYGAVTAMGLGTGYNEIDGYLNAWNEAVRPRPGGLGGGVKSPYYGIDLARLDPSTHNLALGGDGLRILEFDRDLDIVTFEMVTADRQLVELSVPGTDIADRGGYLRQVRGERYEFVPAYGVQVYGKETVITFYVEAGNRIGRVSQGRYKGTMELCDGLEIAFGDNVRRKVDDWVSTRGLQAFRSCEIVYNYSENGNVLDGVSSLANRIQFTISNGRATAAALWR